MIDQPYAFNEYDEPPPMTSLKPEDLARLTADLLSDAEASHNNSGGVRTVSKGVLRKAADAITSLSRELEEARQSTLLVEKELIALRADADAEHAALTEARALVVAAQNVSVLEVIPRDGQDITNDEADLRMFILRDALAKLPASWSSPPGAPQ